MGVKIGKQLKFKSCIEKLRRKASYKLHALRKIRKYLTVEKARFLVNAFINSLIPLILIFAGISSNSKICKMHFRTLQVVYNNYVKSNHIISVIMFLSTRDTYLAIYKSVINMSPEFMWEMFSSNPGQYNLRKANIFCLPPARSSWYGINSLAFRGNLLWNSVTSYVKQSQKDFRV